MKEIMLRADRGRILLPSRRARIERDIQTELRILPLVAFILLMTVGDVWHPTGDARQIDSGYVPVDEPSFATNSDDVDRASRGSRSGTAIEPQDGRQDAVVLGAGEQAQVIATGPTTTIQRQAVSPTEMKRLMELRDGRLTSTAQPIAEVVSEFNRYNAGRLVITDGTLADLRLVGPFPTKDLNGFLSFLQARYGITATVINPGGGRSQIIALAGPRAAIETKKKEPS